MGCCVLHHRRFVYFGNKQINKILKFSLYFIFSKNGLKIQFCMIAELHIFCLNIDNIYLNANVDKTWTNFFMNTSKHRPRSILQRKKRSDWHDTHTNIYIYMCHTNYLCNAVWTYLRKTYKTFSLSHSWSQIQSPPQQWHASSDQTSCRELPEKKLFGAFKYFNSLYLDVFCTKFIVGGVIFAGIVANFHHLEILLCLGVS